MFLSGFWPSSSCSKETLFPDYCIVRKVQSDGAMKDVMPFDRILKVNAVSCKASVLAKMMCLGILGWEGFDLDRMQLKSVEPLPSGQVAARHSR